jgi:hypothetical protein
LRQETNYANTGPVTTIGQTGDHARAASWISDVYTEIQNRHDWRFLRHDFVLTTAASYGEYTYSDAIDSGTGVAIARFKRWLIKDAFNPVRCYLQSSGSDTEYPLTYISWEAFRYLYQLGNQTDGSPSHISIDPQNNIHIGPSPSDVYVITGEFIRSPQLLAANADTPEMPSQYHMAIVYLAMEDFGFFDVAEEIIARGTKKGRRLMRQLEVDQLPTMHMAGPLA